MPGGHIYSKDGTKMIKVRNAPQSPTSGDHPSSSNVGSLANGLVAEKVNGAVPGAGRRKKKKKNRGGRAGQEQEGDALDHSHRYHTHNHEHHDHHHHMHHLHHPYSPPASSGIPPPPPPPQASQEYTQALRERMERYDPADTFDPDLDPELYYSDEEPPYLEPVMSLPPPATTSGKKKNKKKKKKSAASTGMGANEGAADTAGVARYHNQNQSAGAAIHDDSKATGHDSGLASTVPAKTSKDRIWNTSTSEERERIKDFWLSLGEEERRSLVKVEKEAVLKKMKEQQKHSCSCSVCGRKRTAIEEELEVLYDAYYVELEQYANQQQKPRYGSSTSSLSGVFPSRGAHSRRAHHRGDEVGDDDGREESYDDEEDDDDDDEEDDSIEDGSYTTDEDRETRQDFFNFGNSLTVQGGILTVADDLLKNDGKKFIEMMEQLAERRMAREEEASQQASHALAGGPIPPPLQHNHPHMPNGQVEYDEDDEEEEYEDDEYDDDDEDDEEGDPLTEEQRMEEGRRMFQIFAARMFEQRVLSAYRERVAQERQQKLLEELADEERLKEEQKAKKVKDKEKKKDKKRQQKQQKEEERLKREAEKAEEEAAHKAAEQKRAEEAKRKKEEQRLRKEAEKKAAEEERQRREEEKRRRAQEEREREAERERKRKEQQEKDRKRREEQQRKQKEDKETKEKERKEREERDRKDKEQQRKIAQDKAKQRREEEAAAAAAAAESKSAVTKKTNQQAMAPPQLPTGNQQSSSSPAQSLSSPRMHITTPALPIAASPGKRGSSQRGSVVSSPMAAHSFPNNPVSPTATITPMQPGAIGPTGKSGLQFPSQQQQQQQQQQPQAQAQAQAQQQQPQLQQLQQQQPQSQPLPAGPLSPHHIAPPPGVPIPPEGFVMPPMGMGGPPVQSPFMGGMQHPRSMGSVGGGPIFPPPGHGAFPPGSNYRGFSGGGGINGLPMPLPAGGGRGFPQQGRGLFMGDLSAPPQPLPGSNFPPPFPQRAEAMQVSGRQLSSGGIEDPNAMSAPKPIHRPTPIQRPASVVPPKASVDELSTSLGSSALLGDDEPEGLLIGQKENASPRRRGSNVIPSRGVFGIPLPMSSPFLSGPPGTKDGGVGNGAFGLIPSASNTWGAPSHTPLGSLPSSNGWGMSTGWSSIPEQDPIRTSFNRRGQTRLDHIRIVACQLCRDNVISKDTDGYADVQSLLQSINSSSRPNIAGEVQLDELNTVTEIEGDQQNGGGIFHIKGDNGARHVKFEPDIEDIIVGGRQASSSISGGSFFPPPGEIGSPSSATPTFPFLRQSIPGTVSHGPF